jgi:hypothetical protein
VDVCLFALRFRKISLMDARHIYHHAKLYIADEKLQ